MTKNPFIVLGIILCVACFIFILVVVSGKSSKSAIQYDDKIKYMGVVGGDTPIERSTFERLVSEKEQFAKWSKQKTYNPEVIKKLVLDQLVADAICQHFATEKGIRVSDEEIKAHFTKILKTSHLTEEELLRKIDDIYGETKDAYFDSISKDILKEKIQFQTEIPFSRWLEDEKKHISIVLY